MTKQQVGCKVVGKEKVKLPAKPQQLISALQLPGCEERC